MTKKYFNVSDDLKTGTSVTVSDSQIRTANDIMTAKKVYCAKDVCQHLGISWGGNSLNGVDKSEIKSAKLWNSNGRKAFQKHTCLTEVGVNQLCAHRKKPSVFGATAQLVSSDTESQNKKIQKLEEQLDQLKQIIARSELARTSQSVEVKTETDNLTNTVNSDRVVNQVSTETTNAFQAAARRDIRYQCEKYADQWAEREGVTEKSGKKFYFDLTYNALYTKFKNDYPDAPDLRKAAKELSKTGSKTTALQYAEQNGYAVPLLKIAKKLFPLSK